MTLHLYVTLHVPGPRGDLTPLQWKLCKLWGEKRPLQSQNSPTQAGILHVSWAAGQTHTAKKSFDTYLVFLLLIVFTRCPRTVAGAGFGYRAHKQSQAAESSWRQTSRKELPGKQEWDVTVPMLQGGKLSLQSFLLVANNEPGKKSQSTLTENTVFLVSLLRLGTLSGSKFKEGKMH